MSNDSKGVGGKLRSAAGGVGGCASALVLAGVMMTLAVPSHAADKAECRVSADTISLIADARDFGTTKKAIEKMLFSQASTAADPAQFKRHWGLVVDRVYSSPHAQPKALAKSIYDACVKQAASSGGGGQQ